MRHRVKLLTLLLCAIHAGCAIQLESVGPPSGTVIVDGVDHEIVVVTWNPDNDEKIAPQGLAEGECFAASTPTYTVTAFAAGVSELHFIGTEPRIVISTATQPTFNAAIARFERGKPAIAPGNMLAEYLLIRGVLGSVPDALRQASVHPDAATKAAAQKAFDELMDGPVMMRGESRYSGEFAAVITLTEEERDELRRAGTTD